MEKKEPLVSICIPAYNAQKYIGTTLDSLLNQSYQNLEIIVVNDGSTDGTMNVLKSYEAKGITVLDQPNRGQCAAANSAFRVSNGEYIKFVDADDLLSRDFIKNQIATLNGRRDSIASAAWGRFYGDDLSTFNLNPEKVWQDMPSMEWLVESLWNGPNMMQCALFLIPREVLEKSGLWDERLSLINDFDFFIRVILASQQILFTENATLYYRSGIENSLSAQKSRRAYESAYLSTELGVKWLLAAENSERVRKICADAFQLWKYDFYPNHNDLYSKSETWIKKLGGSQYPFPAGGITKTLAKFTGWKFARRFKLLIK
ncbi:glycosyltransferase family 2 protein [Desertivirga xinjiangensis]|uniref:glycosyltransferase family 2 protein n=1 Tax=Desertivirga xinjiangensis TaxID=539206 RepID=UPI00210A99A5|nr:glycosyltransferase family A protein [Pedobacter xinjiangensis]